MAAFLYTAIPRYREAVHSIFSNSSRTFFTKTNRSFKPPTHCHRSYCHATALPVVDRQNQRLRSHCLVEMEYADLNLRDDMALELGHMRIRQHVNPLKSSLMQPVEVPDWNSVYKDSTLPLMVDIGSGSGRFLLWLAKRNQNSKNYLGVEIRSKLVKRSQIWVNELALNNIHFITANAMMSFKELVSTYNGPVLFVSILCPDPHFKNKYRKRRVVQKPLVDSIVESLAPGGQVYIQSDVLEVAQDMRNYFDDAAYKLTHIDEIDPSIVSDKQGWLSTNPMGIRTEREIHAETEGAKIYRRMYQKQS